MNHPTTVHEILLLGINDSRTKTSVRKQSYNTFYYIQKFEILKIWRYVEIRINNSIV